MMVLCGAPPQAASLTGTVKDASGQPVAGAFVKVKSADSRLLYMVISREQGRYNTPELPPGKYMIQALGGEYETRDPITVDVKQQPLRADVAMNAKRVIHQPPKTDYTEEEYAELMPSGEGKDILLAKCVVCHSSGNFVSRRKTPADWKDTVVKMRYRWEQLPMLVEAYTARTGNKVDPITDSEVEIMSDYLAANFNLNTPPLITPLHPDYHLPRSLLKGDEAKYAVLEINLGDALASSYDIDPQGIIWISEKTSGILGRLDPKTLSYSRVYTPPVNVTEEFFGGVAVDPRGKVWFSSNVVPNAQWFQYDPATQKIMNTYDVPLPTRPGGDIFFNSFTFPENGTVWSVVTAFHKIVKLDPVTREIKEFPLREGAHPFGMTIAGDGNIWYAGDNDDLLVQIDPDTDEMTPVKLNPKTGPRRLATDGEGNIWAAAIDRSALVKFDYRTGRIAEFAPPSSGQLHGKALEKILQGVDVDKQRNLVWFSEYEAIKVGRFNPATGAFLEFPLITAESQPWIIKVDPNNPDRIWWNARNGRIGYLELTQ
jgi:virginiamycin B lyase